LIRSATKLASIVIRCILAALRSGARGDTQTAKEYLRSAALSVHDDLVQINVALQRVVLGSKRLPANLDRILIVKLDRIGDMINAGPVLDALRQRFPGARLDIVAHPIPLSLLEGDERVAGLFAHKSPLYHDLPLVPPGPRSWWMLLKLLWKRYPLVVYLRGTFLFLPLGLTSRLAATKFVEKEHVLDRNMKPIEQLLGPIPDRQLRLHIQPEAARVARGLFSGDGSRRGPRIAIHAASIVESRIWPAERFSEVADRLASHWDAQVHFLGSAADRARLASIAGRAREPHAYHDSLSLPETVALIAQCDLFIGNDSGLSHVAAAVGTPLVLIWGSSVLSTARPAARPGRIQILYHVLPCRATCPEIVCNSPTHLECLRRTRVDDVLDAASRLLEAHGRLQKVPVQAGAGNPGDVLTQECHP
jgi:ADP-heptose:LPS heptosyltransferase